MKAVIDRFEAEYAILLFEDYEVQVDFPKVLLPERVKEGDVVSLDIQINGQETEKRRSNAENLLEKLNRKNKI